MVRPRNVADPEDHAFTGEPGDGVVRTVFSGATARAGGDGVPQTVTDDRDSRQGLALRIPVRVFSFEQGNDGKRMIAM